MGVQKGSLYAHIDSKQDLLYETMRDGADAFHAALDAIPERASRDREDPARAARAPARRRASSSTSRPSSSANGGTSRASSATRSSPSGAATRSESAALFREGRERGELRTDLDEATAALLFLSAANWAYTWLQAGRDTDALADRFYSLLVDGMRGYATPT